MRTTAFLLLVAALWLPACSSEPSGTAPSPAPGTFTGTWSGDILVQSTPARMTWTLTQSGSGVSGNVLVGLPTGTVVMNGTVAGTATGSTMIYTITVNAGGIPSQPACTGQLGGTATATTTPPLTLSGSYTLASSTCNTPLTNGSFELTKRS